MSVERQGDHLVTVADVDLSPEIPDVGLWPVPEELYFANRSRVSHSALKLFAKSRRLFRMWLDGADVDNEKDHFKEGAAFHCYTLEPERYAERFAVYDGRRSGKAWDNFAEKNAAKTILRKGADDNFGIMRNAVMADNAARAIIEGAEHVETPLVWTHRYGLPARCKPDLICPPIFGGEYRGKWIVADLKTAANPAAFGMGEQFGPWLRMARQVGYHSQAAWYLDGFTAWKRAPVAFVFIVVGKEEPFDCFCYQFNERTLDLGRAVNDIVVSRIKHCLDAGDWRHPGQHQITTVGYPEFVFRGDLTDE